MIEMTEPPLLVDPARCRLWSGHPAHHRPPDHDSCRGLLESLRRQGRQEVPAIVRRLPEGDAHEFEVVCGARRHWATAHLRAYDLPQFGFLIEPRQLTDEQAFRLADVENRHRRSSPDHLRAAGYAHALEHYYDGCQWRMAQSIGLSEGHLSRFLALARLPDEIIECLGGPSSVRVQHAALLAPLLRLPLARDHMVAAAIAFAPEQAALRTIGHALPPAEMASRLAEIGREIASRPSPLVAIRDRHGFILAQGRRNHVGSLVVTIPIAGTRNRPEVLGALAKLLNKVVGPAEA